MSVTAVDALGERRSTVISDENGNYRLAGLQSGIYTVTVVLPGFQTETATGIALGAQERRRLDFTLRIPGPNKELELPEAQIHPFLLSDPPSVTVQIKSRSCFR